MIKLIPMVKYRLRGDNVRRENNFWKYVDRIIEDGIEQRIYPGAVLIVGLKDVILYEKAYGTLDGVKKVSIDTIYDLASLTKVIATTTAIMRLFGEGRIFLYDKVGDFINVEGEKAEITIFELLSHTSGLQPYSELWRLLRGKDLKEEILKIQPTCKGKMQYSCLNFITLMSIVESIAGDDFDSYIEKLLELPNTCFNPKNVENCAPTSEREGRRLRGEPDDELSYYLGGVSGNAGLFSTAKDIHIFVNRLLDGYYVSRNVVDLFTQTVVYESGNKDNRRHLGWMVPISGGSAGDFAHEKMFGHTGFTGTSLWITPEGLHVILLTNKGFYDRWNEKMQRVRALVHNVVFANFDVRNGDYYGKDR